MLSCPYTLKLRQWGCTTRLLRDSYFHLGDRAEKVPTMLAIESPMQALTRLKLKLSYYKVKLVLIKLTNSLTRNFFLLTFNLFSSSFCIQRINFKLICNKFNILKKGEIKSKNENFVFDADEISYKTV